MVALLVLVLLANALYQSLAQHLSGVLHRLVAASGGRLPLPGF